VAEHCPRANSDRMGAPTSDCTDALAANSNARLCPGALFPFGARSGAGAGGVALPARAGGCDRGLVRDGTTAGRA
jgi:hypothetical protein